MSHKRNKTQKQPGSARTKRKTSNSLGYVKEVLTLLGGLSGSILAIYGLVKTFKDDAQGFSWLIVLGGIIWLIFIVQLFQRRKTAAYSLLIISLLGGAFGWISWQSQIETTEKKLIVLVAKFEGPEETYGVRDQIMEELRKATKSYDNTIVVDGKESVTAAQGSEYAREIGKKATADLVIWAWYKPTENPNITIHVENLSFDDLPILEESKIYQPSATIKDLEAFEIQKNSEQRLRN